MLRTNRSRIADPPGLAARGSEAAAAITTTASADLILRVVLPAMTVALGFTNLEALARSILST
jgi:hypothetical protein